MHIISGKNSVLSNYDYHMNENLLTILNVSHYSPSSEIYLKNEIFSLHLDNLFQNNHQFICSKHSHFFSDYYIYINLVLLNATIPKLFYDFILRCKTSDIRFIIIPLIICTQYNEEKQQYDAHSNILIIDNLLNTIEFFEPHGKEFSLGNFDVDIESTIKFLLNELFPLEYSIYTFFNLQNQCPIGIQSKQTMVDIYVGHCHAWSLLLIELRLLNFMSPTQDIKIGRAHV
jgi:hypothetical protein